MKKSVENSLNKLRIPIIDILFLHDPDAVSQSDVKSVLKQMEFFKQQGYATKIGLGGNAPTWFEPYLDPDLFDVIMEHNRLNACCIDALYTTIPACRENNQTYHGKPPKLGKNHIHHNIHCIQQKSEESAYVFKYKR